MKKDIEKVDASFVKNHKRYLELHKAFDVFRGKTTTKEDNEAISLILDEMTSVYAEMSYVINLVLNRYKVCAEVINHCNKFLSDVQNGGAPKKPKKK